MTDLANRDGHGSLQVMGAFTESAMLQQLKKAQGETNQRLDALLAAQLRTNELLEALVNQRV